MTRVKLTNVGASTQSQLADLSDGASSNLPPWMEDRFPLGS